MFPLCALFAQGAAPLLRGRVLTDSGASVVGASVVVTAVPSAASRTTMTDSGGAYALSLPELAAEYVLAVSAPGRRTYQRRIGWPVGRMEMTINVALVPAVTMIAPVRVAATRSRPARQAGSGMEGINGLGTDPGDRTVDGVQGALPPDLAGDLAAIASTIPGLVVTPDGVSALGSSSESNATVLNGLAAPITQLPRDAAQTTRFSVSPWDPTIGGVSGVRTSVTLSSGSNITTRRTRATVDAPPLQFGDGASRTIGQRYTAASWSGGADGPIALGRWFYNTAATVSRRATTTSSLLDLNPQTLTRSGVALDSAGRFISILRSLGVPLSGTRTGSAGTTTNGVLMARIDHAPRVVSDSASPSWWVVGFASGGSSRAAPSSMTATPSVGTSLTNATGVLQTAYSRYVGAEHGTLNETSTSLSGSVSRSTPVADLPAGTVAVTSDMADLTRAIGSLSFGGNGAARQHFEQWTWDAVNTTTMYPTGQSSFVTKLYLESRLDGYSRLSESNVLGAYGYSSLADLEANRPATFMRTLASESVRGGEWGGASALAFQVRRGRLYWSGGLRGDANAFDRPARNTEVERVLGVRTDAAPNSVALSPRIGFTWFTGEQQYSVFNGSLVNQIRGEQQFRGGVGLFRDYPSPALLASAVESSSGGSASVACFADAVPPPDWGAFTASENSIPRSCRDAPSARVDTAPGVVLFSPQFKPRQSWRAMLGWTGRVSRIHIALDATYSLNQHVPSTIDLNFGALPKFHIAEEAGRDVFVAAPAIDASTGLVSPADARRYARFGPVLERVSDLRGSARQLAGQLVPSVSFLRYVSFGYTYLDAKAQFRGFDGRAAGDPRAIEWGPSSVPRHQVIVQLAQYVSPARAGTSPAIARLFGVTAFVRASSGIPFTPMTDGDINGDGRTFDRAFVFDAARNIDSTRDQTLRTLLNGSERARRCLVPQVGRIAGINSCTGDWAATMNASVFLFPHRAVDNGPRVHASLTVSNVLAGLDELLHGNDRLRGWGAPSLPDPVLYRVRGFDLAKRQFLYEVNPRFGTSSPATTPFRNPMRLTLDVMIDLGRPRAEQELEQNLRLQLPLVGTRAPVDSLKRRYLARPRTGFFDLYGAMLELADSLALSRDQVDSLRSRQGILRQVADAMYGDLAAYLHELPKHYDGEEALRHVQRTSAAMLEVLRAEGPFVLRVLTRGQVERLPIGWRTLLTPTGRVDPE